MVFQKKLNIELPAMPLLGIYQKKMKIEFQRNICISIFIVALFIIAKIGKQPMCPSIDKWMKRSEITIYMDKSRFIVVSTQSRVYSCLIIY